MILEKISSKSNKKSKKHDNKHFQQTLNNKGKNMTSYQKEHYFKYHNKASYENNITSMLFYILIHIKCDNNKKNNTVGRI